MSKRDYFAPQLQECAFSSEQGFSVSDHLNDTGAGTGDIDINYGGIDDEWA